MRLARIEIENFKGVGAMQVIDLKPITLLFGPNSAGKSTILQSLHYLREILERRNADPDQTIAGGLIDLGGFATLIHGHDLKRSIVLKVTVDGIDGNDGERLPLNSGASLGAAEFEKASRSLHRRREHRPQRLRSCAIDRGVFDDRVERSSSWSLRLGDHDCGR
ncbi:MAG: AAA family ATPase [Terricaulis sp.]|nr:AAA family ATPase [Terricaulis sp.]